VRSAQVYGVDWDERAERTVMMPLLSSNPNSKMFDMCKPLALCASSVDIAGFIASEVGVSSAIQLEKWKSRIESLGDGAAPFVQYASQSGPGLPDGVAMSDSGELDTTMMMENLDCKQ
jgi:hypothetical protein